MVVWQKLYKKVNNIEEDAILNSSFFFAVQDEAENSIIILF